MPKDIRQTFGVIDSKTGKLYPDIIDYSIKTLFIADIKLLPNSVLELNKEFYYVHCDSKLKRKLKEEGLVKVIVSFQNRTYGNYAECRIYQNSTKGN